MAFFIFVALEVFEVVMEKGRKSLMWDDSVM
jgi:hypothetical protein